MGSQPEAPDTSKQDKLIAEQSAALKKEQEEAKRAKEALASKSTEELKGIRRRGRGRASLITTSEKGFAENNKLKN